MTYARIMLAMIMIASLGQQSQAASSAKQDAEQLFLKAGPEASGQNVVYLERLQERDALSEGMVQFRAGSRTLSGFHLSNDYYDFRYPENMDAFTAALGWESTPVRFGGRLGARFDLAYSQYSVALNEADRAARANLRLSVIPLSVGIVYLADLHPALRWALPAVELGGDYNVFLQRGDVDGAQIRGGAWTAHGAVGVRHSLAWAGLENSQLTVDYRTIRSLSASNKADFKGNAMMLGFASHL